VNTVIIPPNLKPAPSEVEVSAAQILADYFNTSVEFLIPSTGYKQRTPDIIMNGVLWEIKAPLGKSKKTIEKQIRAGLRQSLNIILDCRRTPLNNSVLQKQITSCLMVYRRVKRLIIITKQSTVLIVDKRKRPIV